MIEQEYSTADERLANSRAEIEQYRLRQLSRGMVQQVYNDNTYRMEFWGHLGYVCGHILRDSQIKHLFARHEMAVTADLGSFLSWQYKENTVQFAVSNPTLRDHGDYAMIDLIKETLMFSNSMAWSRYDNPNHN